MPQHRTPPRPSSAIVNSLPVHRVLVVYPSGKEFVVTGHWAGPKRMGQETAVWVFPGDDTETTQSPALGLDPRGVYVALDTREVLYTPRWPGLAHAPWVRQFLRENPTWPDRLLGVRFRDLGREAAP